MSTGTSDLQQMRMQMTEEGQPGDGCDIIRALLERMSQNEARHFFDLGVESIRQQNLRPIDWLHFLETVLVAGKYQPSSEQFEKLMKATGPLFASDKETVCRFYGNILQDRNMLQFHSKFQLFSFVCGLDIITTMEFDLLKAVFAAMSDEHEFDIGKAFEILWERLYRGDTTDHHIARFLVEIYTDSGYSPSIQHFLNTCFFLECPDSLFAIKMLLQKYEKRLHPQVNGLTDPFVILSTGEYSKQLLGFLKSDDHSLAKCALEILKMMPTLKEVNDMLRQMDEREPVWGTIYCTKHLFLFLYYTTLTVNILREDDTEWKKSFFRTGGSHYFLKAILELCANEDRYHCETLPNTGFLLVEQDEWVTEMTDSKLIEWVSLMEVLMRNYSPTADLILEKNDRVELLIFEQKSIEVSKAYTSIVKQAIKRATSESKRSFMEFMTQQLSSFQFLERHYQSFPDFFEIMLTLLQETFTWNKDLFMKLTVLVRTCLIEKPLLDDRDAHHAVDLSIVLDILARLRPPRGDQWGDMMCAQDLIECILDNNATSMHGGSFSVDLTAYQRFLLYMIPLESKVIEKLIHCFKSGRTMSLRLVVFLFTLGLQMSHDGTQHCLIEKVYDTITNDLDTDNHCAFWNTCKYMLPAANRMPVCASFIQECKPFLEIYLLGNNVPGSCAFVQFCTHLIACDRHVETKDLFALLMVVIDLIDGENTRPPNDACVELMNNVYRYGNLSSAIFTNGHEFIDALIRVMGKLGKFTDISLWYLCFCFINDIIGNDQERCDLFFKGTRYKAFIQGLDSMAFRELQDPVILQQILQLIPSDGIGIFFASKYFQRAIDNFGHETESCQLIEDFTIRHINDTNAKIVFEYLISKIPVPEVGMSRYCVAIINHILEHYPGLSRLDNSQGACKYLRNIMREELEVLKQSTSERSLGRCKIIGKLLAVFNDAFFKESTGRSRDRNIETLEKQYTEGMLDIMFKNCLVDSINWCEDGLCRLLISLARISHQVARFLCEQIHDERIPLYEKADHRTKVYAPELVASIVEAYKRDGETLSHLTGAILIMRELKAVEESLNGGDIDDVYSIVRYPYTVLASMGQMNGSLLHNDLVGLFGNLRACFHGFDASDHGVPDLGEMMARMSV